MKTTYNYSTIFYLFQQGFHPRHVAIIMNASQEHIERIKKTNNPVEITNKFITKEQKQRMLVLQRFLQVKPVEIQWSSNNYYYITILKFLLIPRETVFTAFKFAPEKYVAQAYKEVAPKLRLLDYTLLGVNEEEYQLFVSACYNILGTPLKWK